MYRFSVPSKTFLIGEYAVLQGGSGLLIGTYPRFHVLVKLNANTEDGYVEGLSPQGPAMDFLNDHLDIFSQLTLKFWDPHEGKGGFGWSSAQFLLLYAIKAWFENNKSLPHFQREKILEDYLKYAWNGEGWAPSGLDVLSQLEGGLLQVTAPKKIEASKVKSVLIEDFNPMDAWPFSGIDFCLIRTGVKVATHVHLSNLSKINFSKLAGISLRAGQSLNVGDEELFISCINEYRQSLEEQSLTDKSSQKTYKMLQDRPEVLAYKGCGALGADVILIVLVKELKSDFEYWIEGEGFDVIASSDDLCSGLSVETLRADTEAISILGANK